MEKSYSIYNTDYIQLGRQVLNQLNVPSRHAEIVMENLLDSDKKGIYTHGFYRLDTYIQQIKRGNINPNPKITKVKDHLNIKLLDGDDGFGYVVSQYAMEEAIAISENRGVGVVGVRKSNHFGAAAYYAEMAAMRNQIGIVMTNASPAIAPTGSLKPVLGNNPWSISIPTHLGYPITLDIANSVSARGKIRLKALNGESIPLGWALNENGEPTTDAEEALKGVILPIGDYKGYGITLMIDILTGVLTGAKFGNQVPLVDQDGKRNNGHLFISLDIKAFMELSEFKDRVDELIKIVKSAPKIREEIDILLPGEREWQTKLSQEQDKVKLPERIFNFIHALSTEYHLPLPKNELLI
ncbi:Ldh family oxidoreductase [Alkalihalobacillus sp. BA299]|uniref:Ldh family oxidoreductase n=1 Tax=Alkalihalobacillus sp. BA299 TaxID=2815938 RepID=UPI001ADBB8BA|nr:Ldh family oxidoreductase [Alkalihalobacillus sp. BA299]